LIESNARQLAAQVAEWQTRWLQVPVPARVWRFDSSLGHIGVYMWIVASKRFELIVK
jgi:hypothetical protein